ncbi:Panacea domain-containing protein [Endozoicomonas sp. ALD040]|uniref:Panacea domain-containing protein n=1 Tax=unclassified Endozoicomonas TaxID=2644528 RepID=UPI003BB14A9A
MTRLQNIIAYFCTQYPHKGELSKARLTKLVYLADWFSALADEKQLTSIKWLFNHYGPYVDDVFNAVKTGDGFTIAHEKTMYGSDKLLIGFDGNIEPVELSPRDKQILDAVITKTKTLYFNDFTDYVYSTFPVVSKDRYSYLDLVGLAQKYKVESTLTNGSR